MVTCIVNVVINEKALSELSNIGLWKASLKNYLSNRFSAKKEQRTSCCFSSFAINKEKNKISVASNMDDRKKKEELAQA